MTFLLIDWRKTGNVPAAARVPRHPAGPGAPLRCVSLQDPAQLQRGPLGPLRHPPHCPRLHHRGPRLLLCPGPIPGSLSCRSNVVFSPIRSFVRL